jgi:hypothetical protein
MIEYILVFTIGLFLGLGFNSSNSVNYEEENEKRKKMIINRINEDYKRGYIPDIQKYKKLYEESLNEK